MPSPMPPVPLPPRSPSARSGVRPSVLVVTADPVLTRHLLSVVAAVGLAPAEPRADDDVRRGWRSAGAVLVGRDRAERVDALGLPPRREVFVVGRDEERSATAAWSTRLRAAVATLPGDAADLADALSALVAGSRTGPVVALTGGSGGVGASTLAAALALQGAREGLRALLLDTDLAGGGIDVVLGAEHVPGWRWSRLEAARGHLGDLTDQLPHCDGVDVLAADRAAAAVELAPEQVAAVLDSATRSHDLTVVDVPHRPGPAHTEVLRRAGSVLLVARADVRGVAAADHAARRLVPLCRELEVVVRTGRAHGLAPRVVADALDLPLAGVLEEDHAVGAAAERGEPPGRPGRSPLVRLCAQLLAERLGVAA